MASQDRRYQYEQYQQDDYFRDSRRDRGPREFDRDDDRGYGRSDRDYREALSGYGQGRETQFREGRGWGRSDRGLRDASLRRRDDYGADDLQRDDYESRQGAFSARRGGEGFYGQRGDQWERERQDYSGDAGARGDRDPSRGYRSGGRSEDWGRRDRGYDYGSGARGGARGYDDQDERPFWDRASDEVSSWFGDDAAARRRRQDQARDQYARYSGIGPKNYRRSDERVREDVSDRLSDDPYVNAGDIEVAASNGEVTLTGMADDREQRRRAEVVAERVSGVSHVQNNLRVRGQGLGAGAQGGQSGASAQSGQSSGGSSGQSGQSGLGSQASPGGATQGQSSASRQG